MSSAASWLWQSSADWHAYPPAVCAQLDAARARGDDRVPLDGGRHVDLHAMKQVVTADPSRSRAVKRVAPAASASSASSASSSTAAAADDDGDATDVDEDNDDTAAAAAKRPRTTPQLGWRLNRLHSSWVAAGAVPASANRNSVGLSDLLSASALSGATEVHLHNFMIDLDWMITECPALGSADLVRVFFGDTVAPQSTTRRSAPRRFQLYAPPLETYGCYHSKAILILRPASVTVHVVTANFIFPDWHNKTNGVWSGEFPRRAASATAATEDMGADWEEYYVALAKLGACLLYTSPSPRDKRQSRMPSSA